MNSYRVVIDTVHEQYEYEVEADSESEAITEAEMLARGIGWDGGGLPAYRVTQLD